MASPNSVKILDICEVAAAFDSTKSATETILSPTFFELSSLRFPPSECLCFFKLTDSNPTFFHSVIFPSLKQSLSHALLHFLFYSIDAVMKTFSQPNEPRGESSLSVRNGGKTKCSRQLELDANPFREHGPTTASGIVYSSMPTMYANEQLEDLVPYDRGGSMLAKPCPEPIVGRGLNGKLLPCHQFEGQAQSRIFSPYWSVETVNEALEKGDVFKVLFRVNAHNRLEAYCKIEGVPTDLLISGIAAQNRAVSLFWVDLNQPI